ncbi:MAG: methyltransferase domain-containing protein [Ignavibacteria bacterium]|nr:methyltransferase domain-containing protein [Ignavibacteria bacterium]
MSWRDYYEAVKTDPRPALMRALQYFAEHPPGSKTAYDLGCGNGRDTIALLKEGWKVTAVDSEPSAIELIMQNLGNVKPESLNFVCSSFEDMKLKEATLVNAGYSLPFCEREHFNGMMQSVTKCISKGGLFTGNFFGIRDEYQELSLVTEEGLKEMFTGFDFLYFKEEEFDGPSVSEPEKHWHIFEVTAIKK